jgi:hypothetical protein
MKRFSIVLIILSSLVSMASPTPKLGRFESELTACDMDAPCVVIATFYQLSEAQALEACEFHALFERKANASQKHRIIFSCAISMR